MIAAFFHCEAITNAFRLIKNVIQILDLFFTMDRSVFTAIIIVFGVQ